MSGEEYTSDKAPSLKESRDEKKFEVELCDKISKYIGFDATGEALYDTIHEIISLDDTQPDTSAPKNVEKLTQEEVDPTITEDKLKKTFTTEYTLHNTLKSAKVDERLNLVQARQKIVIETKQKKSEWESLVMYFGLHPTMSLENYEKIESSQPKIGEVVTSILEFGADKEEALQTIHEIQGRHLPKMATFLSAVGAQIGPIYGQEVLTRENINRNLYGVRLSRLYKRITDPARSSARMRASRMEFSRELRQAQEIMAQAQPAMDAELAKKGLSEAVRKKMYGRAVVFLSENPTGQKIASLVDVTANSGVGKIAESTFSNIKEGTLNPLFAALLVCSLDGEPDREKSIIQYFTFLLAGQVIQEGGTGVAKGMVTMLEKLISPGDGKAQKVLAYLKNDLPKNKILMTLAVITLITVAFRCNWVANKIEDVADWIDHGIPYGKNRESVANAIEILASAASWEFLVGWEVTKEVTGLNGVNPFKNQLEFLSEHPGKEGIDAWNKRVSELQNQGSITDAFQKPMGETQKAILEEHKIVSPDDWAKQNITPFQIQVNELNLINSRFVSALQDIPESPSSEEPLLKKNEKLRYEEYALADNDVWNSRDHLSPEETGLGPNWTVKHSRLEGLNGKAITWLRDDKGSAESRLEDFFYHLDGIISKEEAKCMRSKKTPERMVPQGPVYGGVPLQQFERDEGAYDKFKSWREKVQDAKEQWMLMHAKALEVAKRVTVARSLEVYNQKRWTAPVTLNGNNLAFQGLVEKVAHNQRMIQFTTPTDANKANDILNAVGSGPKMYGSDILSSDWRKKSDDEYEKWAKHNGFGIDDRQIHADRVQILIREAYTAGIPQEYIEETLKPVSSMARNQIDGQYITPDHVENIESELGRLLLDKALRDRIANGGTIESIGGVQYTCQQYEFSRYFSFNGDTVTQKDRVKTTSYRALAGGDFIQKITSDHPIAEASMPRKQFENMIRRIQKEVAAEKAKGEKEAAEKKAESDARNKLLREKYGNRSNNATAFQEYYTLPNIVREPSFFGKWEKVTPDNAIPIIYVSRCFRMESAGNESKKNVWEWKHPAPDRQINVAIYWGPGDTKEVNITNIKNFKYAGWDKKTQEAMKIALISGPKALAMRRIIELTECASMIETHFIENDTNHNQREKLISALTDYLLKIKDDPNGKEIFVRKTLDALIDNGGIAEGDIDNLVKKITQ